MRSILAVLLVGVLAVPASAEVLCAKKNGSLVLRAACKGKERAVATDPFAPPPTLPIRSAGGAASAVVPQAGAVLASLDVPAGSYLVVARLEAVNQREVADDVICQVRAGSGVVANARTNLGGIEAWRQTLALVGAKTIDAAATVELRCNAAEPLSIIEAREAVLVAVPADGVVAE